MMLLTSMATNNEEEFSISRPNISQQKQKLSENAKLDEQKWWKCPENNSN